MVAAIDRKLLRDLARLRGQVLTIALVSACGIASYSATRGTYESLLYARDAYYERQRFADGFAHLERAPDALLSRVQDIPGISLAYGRILEPVKLPLEGLSEPAQGHAISLPVTGTPLLNGLHLVEGRLPESGRSDEVVLLEAFAKAHALHSGDHVPVVLNGVLRSFRITGVAMSPEYVFSVPPGELLADPKRFAVLWLNLNVLEAAYQMEGAFNDVSVKLQPGASETAAIAAMNNVLDRYGGMGAYGRDKQLSHNVVKSELGSLKSMANILPVIFLAVAAFLVNVVLSRLVQLQRSQIAALKAVGYRDRDIALHYLKLVSVILLIGAFLGLAVGVWIGQYFTNLYIRFFSFPDLRYISDPGVLGTALFVSIATAVVGALATAVMVMRLPPAEAMRPESPVSYRRALSEVLRLHALFGDAARMVLRELERRPLRTFFSALGIAFSVALLVSGRFMFDSIDTLMAVQFEGVQREDLIVTFTEAVSDRATREIAHLPGVSRVEGMRIVPVHMGFEHRTRDVQLFGYSDDADLRRVLDERGKLYVPPRDGVMLSSELAKVLHVRVGQSVWVELLEGNRKKQAVRVAAVVDDLIAMFGHMRLDTLNRLMHEQARVSLAALSIDPRQYPALRAALTERPSVLGISRREHQIELFKRQTSDQMRVFTLIVTMFASIIAVGVVYNNARVSLSMRARDLASLRVLGFRRAEISAVLLGELALQVLIGLPPGMWIGKWLAIGMISGIDAEQYRFPVAISMQTYAYAAVVTLGAAALSALLVRRKLDRLDLIAVLKTRE
jgi:putative ABC transport system permease protein